MSGNAWIVGVSSTAYARWGDRSHASLAEEVVHAALADAQASGQSVERIWFGNCGMHAWGQPNIRGQVALKGMWRSGLLCPDAAVVNVEAACATGSATFCEAVSAVQSGAVDMALASASTYASIPASSRDASATNVSVVSNTTDP